MFPPGYRFKPTVIELLTYYLRKKILDPNFKCKISTPNSTYEWIIEDNVYLHHPSILIDKHREKGEDAWYFFSPRDRKYRNGDRPDRQAGGGSWKASGASKVIADIKGNEIGKHTALVYYDGRINRNKGVKTDWMMREIWSKKFQRPLSDKNMRLDDWVICKIYKTNRQNGKGKKSAEKSEDIEPNSSQSPNPSLSSDPNPCLEQMIMISPKKPLVEEKGLQIGEELASQEKPPKGNSKREGKGKGIQIEDGEKNRLKALKKTMKRSREEIHSFAPTNHASSSSSSSHPRSQHAFPVYGQNATLYGNSQQLGGVYSQSAPLYDPLVIGAFGQNANLGEISQLIGDFSGQLAFPGVSSQLIEDFRSQPVCDFGCQNACPDSQNVYLDKSYQFYASGFGQNPHELIFDPMDNDLDMGVDDFDFNDLDIDRGAVNSLLEGVGGSLDYIGFLRDDDDDGNSPSGAKGSSSSSSGN